MLPQEHEHSSLFLFNKVSENKNLQGGLESVRRYRPVARLLQPGKEGIAIGWWLETLLAPRNCCRGRRHREVNARGILLSILRWRIKINTYILIYITIQIIIEYTVIIFIYK